MALTRNSQPRDRIATYRIGFAVLCAAALAALIPAALYASDAVRAAIFFLCGAVAGIMGVLAWPRGQAGDTASPPLSRRLGADEVAVLDGSRRCDARSCHHSRPHHRDTELQCGRAHDIREIEARPAARTRQSRSRIHCRCCERIQTGERQTAKLRLRGGRGQRFIATITPLGNKQRPVTTALITVHDQSEQHRLLEMRTDFIANASHELRTPLASVRGFIETLQGPARHDEAARHRFLAIMAEQAERMTRLIDDLLLLSRVEEKANLKPTGRVELDELIHEVVRSPSLRRRKNDR